MSRKFGGGEIGWLAANVRPSGRASRLLRDHSHTRQGFVAGCTGVGVAGPGTIAGAG